MNDFIGIQLLFFKVLENSIAASMIVIIIVLLRKFAKKVLNTRFMNFLWIIVILKLILPFQLLSFSNIDNFTEPYVYGNLYNGIINIAANSISEIQNVTGLSNCNQIKKQVSSYTNGIRSKRELLITDKNTIHAFNYAKCVNLVLNILSFVWFIGFIISLCLMIYRNQKFRKTFVKPIYHEDRDIINIFLQCKKEVGINKDIKLIKSGISMPVIHGVFKTAILLPYDTSMLFTNNELRYILLHELEHYKNRDLFLFLLINVLASIHWFNPLIHIAVNKIEDDCELSCDLNVLNMLEVSHHKQYGMLLIKQAEFNVGRRTNNGFCPSLFKKDSQLKIRINNIVNYSSSNCKILTSISVIFTVLFFLFILFPQKNLYAEKVKYTETPPTLYAFWIKDTNSLTNINSVQSMINKMVNIDSKDNTAKLISKSKLNNRIKHKLLFQAICPLPIYQKNNCIEVDTKSILAEADKRNLNTGNIYLIAQYQISITKHFTSMISKKVLLDLNTLHNLPEVKLN